MSRKKKPGSSTSIAVVFLILITFAALFSFFTKIFFVVKESKFREGNTYSIFVSDEKKGQIIAFHKDNNSISIVKTEEVGEGIYKYAEVPMVGFSRSSSFDLDRSVGDTISDVVFKITSSENNVNLADGIRMMLMTRTVSPRDISEKDISGLEESQRDKLLLSIFSDPQIEKENAGVEIVNNTQDSGVGNRYARLVSNIGADIVLVTTGQEKDKSAIYGDEDSYTVKRLSQILNFPIIKGSISKIGDITISIGKNYEKVSKY